MAELKIKADSGGGTVSFKGPATTTSNAAVQLTLPVDDGAANQYLKTDGSGALSWATVASDLVDDTSPQLGGDLDVNGNQIKGDDVQIHAADNQVIAKFHKTNSSEFHFNGSKKLEVNNTGIGVTGSVTPSGGLYLGGSGGSNYLSDYEEGSFTPSFTTWNGSSSIPTINSSYGYYIKTGKFVKVWWFIVFASAQQGNTQWGTLAKPIAAHTASSFIDGLFAGGTTENGGFHYIESGAGVNYLSGTVDSGSTTSWAGGFSYKTG